MRRSNREEGDCRTAEGEGEAAGRAAGEGGGRQGEASTRRRQLCGTGQGGPDQGSRHKRKVGKGQRGSACRPGACRHRSLRRGKGAVKSGDCPARMRKQFHPSPPGREKIPGARQTPPPMRARLGPPSRGCRSGPTAQSPPQKRAPPRALEAAAAFRARAWAAAGWWRSRRAGNGGGGARRGTGPPTVGRLPLGEMPGRAAVHSRGRAPHSSLRPSAPVPPRSSSGASLRHPPQPPPRPAVRPPGPGGCGGGGGGRSAAHLRSGAGATRGEQVAESLRFDWRSERIG